MGGVTALGHLLAWVACLAGVVETPPNEAMQGAAVALERQDIVRTTSADRGRDGGGAAVGVGGDGGAREVQQLEQLDRRGDLARRPNDRLLPE